LHVISNHQPPAAKLFKVAMAQMKAALIAEPMAARRGADCHAAAVISPCIAELHARKSPGQRRKSERLTPH
jgi:hypothetical protein